MTSTIWKTADVCFVTWDATEFMQVTTIVLAYINACFGTESSIPEQVEAASSAEELEAVVGVAPDVSVVMAGHGITGPFSMSYNSNTYAFIIEEDDFGEDKKVNKVIFHDCINQRTVQLKYCMCH